MGNRHCVRPELTVSGAMNGDLMVGGALPVSRISSGDFN